MPRGRRLPGPLFRPVDGEGQLLGRGDDRTLVQDLAAADHRDAARLARGGHVDVEFVHDRGVEALAFEAEAQRAGLGLNHELAVFALELGGVVGVAEPERAVQGGVGVGPQCGGRVVVAHERDHRHAHEQGFAGRRAAGLREGVERYVHFIVVTQMIAAHDIEKDEQISFQEFKKMFEVDTTVSSINLTKQDSVFRPLILPKSPLLPPKDRSVDPIMEDSNASLPDEVCT